MSKIKDTDEAWDDRTLGADAAHVRALPAEADEAIDGALGLQMISIRLPRQLIDQYKLIAHFHGAGYQPLMRDVLTRFVPGALQEILEAEMGKAKVRADQEPNISLPKAA